MDLERSAEQQALAETLRRFLSDRAPIRPYVRGMLDDSRGTTPEVWGGLADLGLTALLVPEKYGGAGMGMVDMGIALEEMARQVHPGPFLSSAVAAVSAVCAAGTEEDKAELLPRLADGSLIGTLALLEPGGGPGRWKAPTTRADPDSGRATDTGRGGWRIWGSKVFVPDVEAAGLILVTGSTQAGVGLFAVAPGAPGLETTRIAVVDGTRKQAHLKLEGVSARLVGEERDAAAEAEATDILGPTLDRILVGSCADGLGAAARALELAVDYAKERVQFDRVIGSFQAVQHMCADMLEDLELSRAGVSYGLWACDAADPVEAHRAATMAKAYASESLPRLGATAVQVLGGIGFTWEHDMHLYYKRLLHLQQAYGSATDHLEELARLVC